MSKITVPQSFENTTADAVVIGGGIVGSSTAFPSSAPVMK